MKELKLKPCPFCGGKAEIHACLEMLNEEFAVQYSGKSGVHCSKCSVATIPYNSEQEAMKAWNRRDDNGNCT